MMLADFDRLNWSDWRRYDNPNEFKRGSAPKTRLGTASQLYFNTDTFRSIPSISLKE